VSRSCPPRRAPLPTWTRRAGWEAPCLTPALHIKRPRPGGQQMGNRPHRTPTIPNELTTAKTALERAPTHSNDPQTWTYGTEGQRFESSRARFVAQGNPLLRSQSAWAGVIGGWQQHRQHGNIDLGEPRQCVRIRRAILQ
jgi:hypothetical protein